MNHFLNSSIRIIIIGTLLAISAISILGQAVPTGWKEVSACGIRFNVPKSFLNKEFRGIDSCVAKYSNGKDGLDIDFGSFGSPTAESPNITKFKEKPIIVDGKKGQLATFEPNGCKASFYTRIHVIVNESKDRDIEYITSLDMRVWFRKKEDASQARDIINSIRFDP